MPSIAERQALRMRVLQALYDTPTGVIPREWARSSALDEGEVAAAFDYLIAQGLVSQPIVLGGGSTTIETESRITAKGIDAFEEAGDLDPAAPFGEPIVLTVVEMRRLEPLLGAVRSLLDAHGPELDPEDAQDLEAQVATIEAQQRSPRPRRDVVAGAVGAIRWMADKAAGAAVGKVAWEAVKVAAKAVF